METQKEDRAHAVRRLSAERDELRRRLADVDDQLGRLSAIQQEELCQRLASLEETVRQLAHVAGLAPATAPPRPAATVARMPPAPIVTAAVSAQAPTAQPAAPTQAAPRIIGERFAIGQVLLHQSAEPNSAVIGWVPDGTRLFITDLPGGGTTQIVFQGRTAWVEANHLALIPPAPAANAPQPATPPQSRVPDQPAVPAQAAEPAASAVRLPPPPSTFIRPTKPAKPPLWQRPGFTAKVLALVGAGVTLIGVAFLLVLAAQYGLFGPEARTIAAAGLAVVLIGLAFIVRRRDEQNIGAPILAATGVAAGYLSVVAATVIYGWLHPVAGLVLAALIGVGGMVLARLWSNQWVALVAVLGSLILAPYIGSSELVVMAALLVVMTGGTLWVELGSGWRLFPFARVLPTVIVLLQLCLPGYLGFDQLPWLVGLTAMLALLGLLSALLTPAEPAVGQTISLGLLVPSVLPAAFAPGLLNQPVAAAIVLGAIAIAYGVLGFLPSISEKVRWATVPIGAIFLMLAGFNATQQRYLGVLTLALACVYLAVATRTKSMVNLLVGGALGTFGVLLWLPSLVSVMSQAMAAMADPEQVAVSVVGIGAVVTGTMAVRRWLGPSRPWLSYVSWSLAIAMGSVAVILAGTLIGGLGANAAAGFQTGQALVTSAWMVLCIVFLRRGLASKHNADVWLRLALGIAVLAVAKLFLADLAMLDAIARVGAFLAVGLLLLFVGTRYAKAWERAHGAPSGRTSTAPPAAAPAPPAQSAAPSTLPPAQAAPGWPPPAGQPVAPSAPPPTPPKP